MHIMCTALAPVYFYEFTHKPSFSTSPAWVVQPTHIEELPFLWGSEVVEFTEEEVELSARMMGYWANFARNG